MLRVLIFITSIFIHLVQADSLETFTADYNIYYGNYKLGEGVYQLTQLNNERYNLSFNSSMSFLIFSDKREVDVEFSHQNNKVTPYSYIHKRKGSGNDYIDITSFNRQDNIIFAEHKGKIFKTEYDDSIFDALSAQLQLMLDLKRGVKKPSYKILEANKVKERFFEFIKEETIQINNKSYRCVMYHVINKKKKRRTEMWFSIDHNYQPVRMSHFDKNMKKFNADLTNFSFDSIEKYTVLKEVSGEITTTEL